MALQSLNVSSPRQQHAAAKSSVAYRTYVERCVLQCHQRKTVPQIRKPRIKKKGNIIIHRFYLLSTFLFLLVCPADYTHYLFVIVFHWWCFCIWKDSFIISDINQLIIKQRLFLFFYYTARIVLQQNAISYFGMYARTRGKDLSHRKGRNDE